MKVVGMYVSFNRVLVWPYSSI